jgi:hypothetical protein
MCAFTPWDSLWGILYAFLCVPARLWGILYAFLCVPARLWGISYAFLRVLAPLGGPRFGGLPASFLGAFGILFYLCWRACGPFCMHFYVCRRPVRIEQLPD